MKLLQEQRDYLEGLIESHSAEVFTSQDIERAFLAFLKEEHRAGRLPGLLGELAHRSVSDVIRQRRWRVTNDQESLFQADALLAIGDDPDKGSQYVRMEYAGAEHLRRHEVILAENHVNQVESYAKKQRRIREWIADLERFGCTLGELENR